MGGYYKYQSVTYSTIGSRPLSPFSKERSDGYYDHDYAPTRKVVPVATRPYSDDYNHGSFTKPYPHQATHDDDEWHHPPQKPHDLPPKRTVVPVSTTPYTDEYQRSSPTKPYRASYDDDWYPQRDDDHDLLTKRKTVVPVATITKPRGSPKGSETEAYDAQKWHSPQKPQATQPVISTNWRRSQPPSTATNGNYNINREEQKKPIESGSHKGSSNKPIIINPNWGSSPRKGNQLSGATNDLLKITAEMMKNANLNAEADHDYNKGHKPTANGYAFPNYDNYNINNNYEPTINHREAEQRYNGATI